MATSSTATAGTNATAQQYNDLRLDAITRKVRPLMSIKGVLVVANGQVKIPIPSEMTLSRICHLIQSGSSATITIKRNTDTVKSGISTTTTYTVETSGLSNTTFAAGDVLILDITGVSGSPTDISVVVEFTETL